MYFKEQLLYDTLNQYENIIIYGTGDYAQEIYPQLERLGLKDKILCFTQTEKYHADMMNGIPVINIHTLACIKTESVVLIAVGKKYVDQIKYILLEYNYLNIVSLIDYQLSYSYTEKEFFALSIFEDYCEFIADWYVKTHMGNSDKQMVLGKLLSRGSSADSGVDRKLIVMICGTLSGRTIKFIEAFKENGFRVVLLKYFKCANPWSIERLECADIQIDNCCCIEEMLYHALQYRPLVYFFEPFWGDCRWAEIMIRCKRNFGKIVLALYDIMNFGYVGQSEEILSTEKYALEHADGILWRWFFKEYLEKKGFQYQGKSLQFIDYCKDSKSVIIPRRKENLLVKLCFVVGHGDEIVEDRTNDIDCMDWARLSEMLASIGNRTDCVFHFYTGSLCERNIGRCEEYKKTYKNFDYFLNTEYDELLKRMKEYDFGCDLFTDKKMPEENTMIGDYYGANIIYGVRNSYADFLEAGLPIITTNTPKLWEYLAKYDIVIKMNLSNLDIEYLKNHKNYYWNQVEMAKKELNMGYQMPRLIQFFNEV